MERYVALWRGINVGKAKRLPMEDLRVLLGRLGYSGVATLLNSGNAVFSASGGAPAGHAQRIRATVAGELGVDAQVVVVGARAYRAILAANPLLPVAVDPSRHLVAFVADPGTLAELADLGGGDWTPEALALGAGAAYLWCPGGILASSLLQAVGRRLGDRVTTRNWATAEKLGQLLAP